MFAVMLEFVYLACSQQSHIFRPLQIALMLHTCALHAVCGPSSARGGSIQAPRSDPDRD